MYQYRYFSDLYSISKDEIFIKEQVFVTQEVIVTNCINDTAELRKAEYGCLSDSRSTEQLPNSVVCASSVDVFKNRIDNQWRHLQYELDIDLFCHC